MASSEEAAFWAALEANPTDDTTRLVFADWLDDRSDPRADWIRDAELAKYMAARFPDAVACPSRSASK